jgi:hypothetical protein
MESKIKIDKCCDICKNKKETSLSAQHEDKLVTTTLKFHLCYKCLYSGDEVVKLLEKWILIYENDNAQIYKDLTKNILECYKNNILYI